MNVKTRIAPSPTGFLHVGNLRTALFDYLVARHHGGTFAVRIEDTDRERLVEGSLEHTLQMLHWAGLTIDEGVDLDASSRVIQKGDLGPYIQSERLPIYRAHADQLLAADHAYFCFCSKERLEELRRFQELNKLPTGYDGHCRDLNTTESTARATVEPHVIRMKMPREGVTAFDDLIRGHIEFKNTLIDDQVIMKGDGFPTYHLAAVVDDHLMQMTHIMRGEEWLSSTPKHIVLYHMFGWKAPQFAHLPLLVNIDKKKLSKRHGDVAVRDYVDKGYLPQALINFVAFLGWNPGDERELFSLAELEREFSLEKVSKNPAVFNVEKLNWFNRQYMMTLPLETVTEYARPFFREHAHIDAATLARAIDLERGRVDTLAELPAALAFLFGDVPAYEAELLVWKKGTAVEAKQILGEIVEMFEILPAADWNKDALNTVFQNLIQAKSYGVGNVMWPLRVALSGQKNSPGPTEIAAVLGQEKTLARVRTAVDKL